MKYRFLFVFLLLILSVGAVNAQEINLNDTQENSLLSSEHVIDDNTYSNYFNDDGKILKNSNITSGDTIKLKNISNKNFNIDKTLNITSYSSGTVLNNVSFKFTHGSDNSIVQNLIFNNLGVNSIIGAIDTNNISIVNNIINSQYFGENTDYYKYEDGCIIYGNSVNDFHINHNKIIGNHSNGLIAVGLVKSNFKITNNEFSLFSSACHGINIMNCLNMIIDNNTINIKSSGYASVISDNIWSPIHINLANTGYVNISEKSNLSKTGKIIISNNVINVNASTVRGIFLYGIDESIIDNNLIDTYSSYFSYVVTSDAHSSIFKDNIIKSYSNAYIVPSYPISLNNPIVVNNNISTNMNFAMHVTGDNVCVMNNILNAGTLTGDFAVHYYSIKNLTIANNTPVMNLTYEVTNDTFFIYFTEKGELRQHINDNLTFVGNFSKVITHIYINKSIGLFGKNASLYGVELVINCSNVTVSGFNFISDYCYFNTIKIESRDVYLVNNTFSDHFIEIKNSNNVLLKNNILLLNYSYYAQTNLIRVKHSNNVNITNNEIHSTIYDSIIYKDYEINVFYLCECNNITLNNNKISVKSEALVCCSYIIAQNISAENNTVNLSDIRDIESNSVVNIFNNEFNLSGNSVKAISINGNFNDIHIKYNSVFIDGDYSSAISMGDCEAVIENNNIVINSNQSIAINFTMGNISIFNNNISINIHKLGTDSMAINVIGGHAIISKNNITVNTKYTIKSTANGNIENNYLIADEYTGDASVMFIINRTIVANNVPTMYRSVFIGKDVISYGKTNAKYIIKLVDEWGNVLANQRIIISINGISYKRVTNINGSASINLNLNYGHYDAITYYDGSGFYSNASNVDNIIIKSVWGDDLVKFYKNSSQYCARFLDGQFNPLSNTIVQFKINNVIYERKTNEYGIAKLNIWLRQGRYSINAINTFTGEIHTNNITVLKTIVSKDLKLYYNNGSQFMVTMLKGDGNPVGAGEKVTFNINGVFYTRKTNADGIARLNIKLQPGNYIITTEYNGCKVSNNIKVLPILYAKNLNILNETDQFKVLLLDGQGNPRIGQNVKFNIEGIFYSNITDDNGSAKLNVNLQYGSYIITTEYDGCKIANTISRYPYYDDNISVVVLS